MSGRVKSVAVKVFVMEGCMAEWKALGWKRKDVWVEKGSSWLYGDVHKGKCGISGGIVIQVEKGRCCVGGEKGEGGYLTSAKRAREKKSEWVISHKTKISPEHSGLGGAPA